MTTTSLQRPEPPNAGRRARRDQPLGLGKRLLGVLLVLAAAHGSAADWKFWKDYQPELVVSDPFIEMHTGPGRGYPVFYVAGQGDHIKVLKRRTDWFKIETPRNKRGWVHISQMRSTLDLDGGVVEFKQPTLEDFAKRRWEVGVVGGNFGGAATLSAYGGFALTPNITAQANVSQILGDFSDGYMGNVNIVMYPFPEWRVSPFFQIGTGIIHIEPQTTIVQTEDRTDEIVNAGIGANIYMSRRFVFRVEYRRHTVLTSRDDNEEIDEWKAGFSVFL